MLIPLENEAATERLAVRLADIVRPGDVITLKGDLGAGKTATARAMIRALSGDPETEVPSPTFTLVQTYEADDLLIRHFDLYRLSCADEVIELGWDDDLERAVTLVEWPERLGSLAPADRLEVTLSIRPDGSREAGLVPFGSWNDRLSARDLA